MGGTSTARLKSGADWRGLNGPSGARRDFRPTMGRYAHKYRPYGTGRVCTFSRHFMPGYHHPVPSGRGLLRMRFRGILSLAMIIDSSRANVWAASIRGATLHLIRALCPVHAQQKIWQLGPASRITDPSAALASHESPFDALNSCSGQASHPFDALDTCSGHATHSNPVVLFRR